MVTATKTRKKTNNVKPRLKHKKILENVVVNGCTYKDAIRAEGYSEAVATQPQKITESKSWQILLNEYLPDDLVLKALQDDIKSKPSNRIGELSLAMKVKGKMIDKQEINVRQVTPILQLIPDKVETTKHTEDTKHLSKGQQKLLNKSKQLDIDK